MRYVDVLSYHDGTEGPAGVPRTCVEHDGTRALERGVVRMTVEEYREAQRAWDQVYALWAADKPQPIFQPTLPDMLPAWACKAALDEAGMLSYVKELLVEADVSTRWRFEAATTWYRSDVEAMGDRYGIPDRTRQQLWERAAVIART